MEGKVEVSSPRLGRVVFFERLIYICGVGYELIMLTLEEVTDYLEFISSVLFCFTEYKTYILIAFLHSYVR